jgi:uncharacterized membrane protein
MTSSSSARPAPLVRQGQAGRRAIASAVVGAIALAAAWAAGVSWAAAVLTAWDATAITYLASVWWSVATLSAARARQIASSEDGSRRAAELLLVGASVASLVAVGFILAEVGRASGLERGLLTAFAVASVLLAWSVVHTVFALRYARLYYAPPVGGLGFADDDPPTYGDFAYVAFTIGMTYQVSDTEISKRPIRRTAIHHALLSYVFGAMILGIIINSIATLFGR